MSTEEIDKESHPIAEGVNYDDWNGIDIMESMCMRCGATGETRLMLHKIPYFRELIIASFICEECGERNNEVTFGGEIQIQGCIYDLKVTTPSDLDRQLIKSDSATVRIPELDFEIPAMTQRGGISTIEGMLKKAAENLAMHQDQRMEQMPEVGIRVAQIIGQLTMMSNRFPSAFPFHIVVTDPAGNSFVENPTAPVADPNMTVKYFNRSPEQDEALGLAPSGGVFRDDKESNFSALMTKDGGGFGQVKASTSAAKGEGDINMNVESVTSRTAGDVSEADMDSGVVVIPTPCPHCFKEGESRTALTTIPHFKEVLIMAFNCTDCGFRTNEVKGGGGVPTYGTEVKLTVQSSADLTRDLLKSDTAMVGIPELELELQHGTLGGVFTTVEGLLQKIVQKLLESNPFAVGDSSTNNHSDDHTARERFGDFIDTLKDCAKGKRFPFTLLMRDPLGNSFISAPLGSFLPPEMDHNLKMTDFERTFDENEELGLNDINTDHYGADGESIAHEEVAAGPILPDRLQKPHVKGPDHPTPFAKGTHEYDNTAGGLSFSAPISTTTTTTTPAQGSGGSTDDGNVMAAPAGWSAEKISVDLHLTDALNQYDSSQSNFYDNLAPLHTAGGVKPLEPAAGDSYHTKRIFSETDLELEYLPREEFGGRREGFVFRLGAQGLGYYRDTYKRSSSGSSADAVEAVEAVDARVSGTTSPAVTMENS
eukprot:CAMPEP_0170395322 /NCGR_PEP_ID=MMETSP0117_2-20130122/21716_1 /TAXON_ID=400756 /ORGANISM="Durinskia baltica, Strain CSIRO CS-38" /LENGTH=708 /DNA_ID=CAMNT_0010651623 /DNA_START=53 /DNA_END=2179 /DNA_ORIENTATION=+